MRVWLLQVLPIRVSPSKTPLQLPDREFAAQESGLLHRRPDGYESYSQLGADKAARRPRNDERAGRYQVSAIRARGWHLTLCCADACMLVQRQVAVRRTVFIRDIDQEACAFAGAVLPRAGRVLTAAWRVRACR
jgi:hypothetical protein